MICLCLTAPTLKENEALLQHYRLHIGIFELRADRLNEDERPYIAAWVSKMARLHDIRGILTVRLSEDGGAWTEGIHARNEFMDDLISEASNAFRWVDLEARHSLNTLAEHAREKGLKIIRSAHDFKGVLGHDQPERSGSEGVRNRGKRIAAYIRSLMHAEDDIPKYAAMCNSAADLSALFSACVTLRSDGKPFILLGMGNIGQPTRILAKKLGSLVCYASAAPNVFQAELAAPGQIDPETLNTLYGYEQIGPQTLVYGVVGNPVMHSKSPEFHNPRLRASGLDATYLRFNVDDLSDFRVGAEILKMPGFSITIPHKEDARTWASERDEAVDQIGAANTLVRSGDHWRAANTDAPGFWQPLAAALEKAGLKPADMTAIVVGAGGAARAVVWALLDAGCAVIITNRTASRAKDLASWFQAQDFNRISSVTMTSAGLAFMKAVAPQDLLVINTTSVGMAQGKSEGKDALPDYAFRGGEWVYDIVYTPEWTPFLQRAKDSGCHCMNGSGMFELQASIQSEMFVKAGNELTKASFRLV